MMNAIQKLVVFSALAFVVLLSTGGMRWSIPRKFGGTVKNHYSVTNAFLVGGNQPWNSVACSYDGQRVYAVGGAGTTGCVHSTDGGTTWTVDFAPNWNTCGCSADGMSAMFMAYNNSVGVRHTINGGSSWQDIGHGAGWHNAQMSGDGTLMVAIQEGAQFHVTTNLFADQWNGPFSGSWLGFGVSSNGQKIVTGIPNMPAVMSTNWGHGWYANAVSTGIADENYAMNTYGTKCVKCCYPGLVYTGIFVPTVDSDLVWSPTSLTTSNRVGLAISADGNTIATSPYYDAVTQVEISRDGGQSWGRVSLPGNSPYVTCIAMSADGKTIYVTCAGHTSDGNLFKIAITDY